MVRLLYALLATARSSLAASTTSSFSASSTFGAAGQQLATDDVLRNDTARRQARRAIMEAKRGESCRVCGPPFTQQTMSAIKAADAAYIAGPSDL